ncbi:hypothetical protein CRYUN_Cryun09bG0086500 [Craigia yunnanensis]
MALTTSLTAAISVTARWENRGVVKTTTYRRKHSSQRSSSSGNHNDKCRWFLMKKALDDIVWLRNFEDPHFSPPAQPSPWPQPYYPEENHFHFHISRNTGPGKEKKGELQGPEFFIRPLLRLNSGSAPAGLDLMMADLKGLEACVSFFYYQSKKWSKPLLEAHDAEEIADYFSRWHHVVAFRLLEVFSSFASAAITIRMSGVKMFLRPCSAKGIDENFSQYNFGIVLKETMLSLGPTFIKVTCICLLMQLVSPFPKDQILLVLKFPRPVAVKIIEEDLGSPIGSFFSCISEEPVYCGSTLDGFDVAVKVQRPNSCHVVVQDIYILCLELGLLQKIAKRKNDPRLYADELGKGLLGELDYTLEAANASEFLDAHSHFSFMQVPKVFQHLTRRRVLTMEWMAGESPTYLLSVTTSNSIKHGSKYLERQEVDAKRRFLDLVNKGVEASLSELLETGMLHADPHPGNLHYTTSGHIGVLDFGLLCRMEKKHQFAMLASIVHIDLEDALGEVEFKDGIPDVKFSRVLGKIWAVALKYHLRMPPYHTLVLRSIASLEGLAVAADPSFKTFEAAYPFVACKLLTENSVEIRKIFHSVTV